MFTSKMIHSFAITALLMPTLTMPLVPDLTDKIEAQQTSTLLELATWAPVVGMVGGAAVSGYVFSKMHQFNQDPLLACFAVIAGGFLGSQAGETASNAAVKMSNNKVQISNNQKASLALLLAHAKDNK